MMQSSQEEINISIEKNVFESVISNYKYSWKLKITFRENYLDVFLHFENENNNENDICCPVQISVKAVKYQKNFVLTQTEQKINIPYYLQEKFISKLDDFIIFVPFLLPFISNEFFPLYYAGYMSYFMLKCQETDQNVIAPILKSLVNNPILLDDFTLLLQTFHPKENGFPKQEILSTSDINFMTAGNLLYFDKTRETYQEIVGTLILQFFGESLNIEEKPKLILIKGNELSNIDIDGAYALLVLKPGQEPKQYEDYKLSSRIIYENNKLCCYYSEDSENGFKICEGSFTKCPVEQWPNFNIALISVYIHKDLFTK